MDVNSLLNNAALEYTDFELPSKGIVYPVKSIKIRPTRTTEEKFLRTIAKGSSDFNEKISKYLSQVTNLMELGFDPAELTTSDQLSLLIYSRILSKDTTDYPTDFICPSCGKTSRQVIKLMDLGMIHLPDDFKEPGEVYLPKHDLYFTVRLLRVKDHINVAEFHRMMMMANNDMGDPEDDYEGLLANTILGVRKGESEISLTYSDKRDLLINLDATSFNLLPDWQDKYYHGYDFNYKFSCPYCLEKRTIAFELSPDFFFRITSAAA